MTGEDKAPGPYRIGTERESSLHRSLKIRYAGEEGRTEAYLEGYVCDGISGEGEVIEVQTGSFGPLKNKVPELAARNPVRIIHPIILTKYIELYDREGLLLYRRKSPRKGSPWDLFKALLYAPELPLLSSLTVELVLIDAAERRVRDGRGSWRRRGDRIADKSLAAYHGSIPLAKVRDYRRFVPFPDGEEFTVQGLGKKAGIKADIARKALYVLTKLQIVRRIGKEGNAWLYVLN
jgi:hypothetical protein